MTNKQNHNALKFPSIGLVLSGGTSLLCLIKSIGDYKVLAKTTDDALGEALDKGARLLGFGYPGGAILEKFARLGKPSTRQARFQLPIPLIGDKVKNRFSYSGLKTAFVRLYNSLKNPTKQDLYDLAASFQNSAFKHVENVLDFQISNFKFQISSLWLGGGVANNIELRKRLRKICKNYNVKLLTPYTRRLNGDNAGMIGITAYLKYKNLNTKKLNTEFGGEKNINLIDRDPKLKIGQVQS